MKTSRRKLYKSFKGRRKSGRRRAMPKGTVERIMLTPQLSDEERTALLHISDTIIDEVKDIKPPLHRPLEDVINRASKGFVKGLKNEPFSAKLNFKPDEINFTLTRKFDTMDEVNETLTEMMRRGFKIVEVKVS